MPKFAVGSTVQRREVLHGHVWMTMPVQVIADDDVLAVWVEEGAPFQISAASVRAASLVE
jgi:hypothetical protein